MDKSEDNNVGLTTTEALDRLYKDIEQVLIQHEKTQVTKRTKFCLKDALHHNSYYTPLCWTSLLAIITYSILLFVAFITKKESNISLIYESIAVALIVALNVGLVFTESRLRHEELPRRVKIILQEIQRASGNERWNVDNYPHLCSPYSPCITLQWTYRDGVLVNLPWALLVKDDVVLIRPGQVSPGYCESIDKSEEYPLLHPKEVYGPSLKNANESISIPKARRPLPNRRYRLLETPYLSNLHLALEQATLRPATRLDSRRRLVITRCVEQCAIPVCAMLALLIGVARRMYLGNVFGGGDAVDVYLLMPAATVLPLMPLVFPVAWIVLNHIGNAKLRALFDYSSISPTSSHSPFDDGDTTSLPLPSFSLRDIWNNFILVACGTGHIMTRTSNMLHVLGSVTALCCVDKKGILSWPNPTAEKVFFLHNVEEDSRASSLENVGDLTDTESVVEKKEDKGFSSANFSTVLAEIPYPDLDKRRGTGIPPNSIPNTIRYGVDQQPVCTVAEVLDLTHDHKDPFKLHFDDQEWSRHISSLKPLGLGILLNTCNLETQEHYAQFCSHVTCEAMYNENLIPVTNRRCLCELAKQIGFSDHAQKIFKLEQQLSTFRHLQPEMMRRDNKFARSLQLSTKLKFPFPHMVAVVVKESSSGAHQLLSQGTADIVLDSCVDYWDGQDLCFLTPSDRKKVLDFYQRTSLTAYCTAFAYRPLNGNVSDKLSQVFLELPSDSKQLFRTRRSPTPIHWDCKTMFEPKFKGPLAQFFSTDSLLFNDSTSTDTTNTDNCFDVQCNQIFIGMVTMQYQAQNDMVHLIEQLERACIRFVHFSKENELRSRVFSEKMGLESGWNCHISLLSERTSNLEQSKAISFSAPSAINLEHATVKFDPEVEHPASCGDSGEGCDLATSEDSMLMPDAPNSTSPAHEHWQSLSCLTDSTEQSAPVHFDMSNRAKLPRGIDKIRPHIEQIDNVPLLVSLFTDCTPSVIREMLHIMQDFGEVVCVMTSSANSDNMGICLQADAALAVEPLYPQVCQRVPAYTHSTTSPSPVELSRALNALSCALSARREDPLAIFPLVMHARHYTRALWSCTQFWLGCSATVTLTQLVAQVVMLPPIMRTGHVLWLVAVIVPLLSISLTFVPTDPAIMRVPLGKESCKINTSALMFILWCYGAKFIPVVLSSVLTYGAALATYCTQICAPENLNCTCSFYYLPHLEEENKWGGWTYHSYTWLAAQHAAIIIIVVHFITISISFVNRHHSIWKKGPHNNLVWICTVAIIIVLHTIFTASNLLIEQSENQLGFGDLSYLILIFACVSIFLTFAITEFVKWKEVKVNLRYQRRARLDFGTKLAHKMWPISLIVGNSCAVVLPVISTLAFCYVSFNVFKWMVGDMTVPISNSSNHHSWRSIRVTAKAWYCSMCESLLVSGFGVYCDCCGVCADQDCVKKVDRKLACKSNMSAQKNMPHHWVKGNLPLGALCHICEEDCSMEPGLVDHQCCWCQRCVHTACLEVVESQSCDFGSNRCLIVPPWCVQVARRKSSVRKKFQIRTVTDPDWPDWSPLIVMGNCKSGNGDGGLVLSEFRRLLNPAQVFDLSEHSPNTALQWCRLVSPYPTKLLVAGGDGTVAWILNTVHKMGINPNPGVAIVPLGTGNDMSRVLGWGREHGVEGSLDDLVGKLKKAETRQFDRWKVDVTPRPTLRLRMPAKHLFMYNYLSVGVDAQVALDFHRTRESRLYLFSNRIFNKLLYLCFGTHQVVAAGCRNLEQRVELYLDGVQTTIPEVEAIVVLNISSWGAGVNLWSMVTTGGDDSQSYNDGKLEVVGIYSSFHMAQLQVGLATPHRIGQAKEVCIKLLAAAPVQVDGEPWEQHPSTILVSRDESANVLVCSELHHRLPQREDRNLSELLTSLRRRFFINFKRTINFIYLVTLEVFQ